MTNLGGVQNGVRKFRIPLSILDSNLDNIGDFPYKTGETTYTGPTMVIRGSNSKYVPSFISAARLCIDASTDIFFPLSLAMCRKVNWTKCGNSSRKCRSSLSRRDIGCTLKSSSTCCEAESDYGLTLYISGRRNFWILSRSSSESTDHNLNQNLFAVCC